MLITLALTGIIRAGTDIYYPPLGGSVQAYLANPGVVPESLIPYVSTGVDNEKMASIKAFKGPFGTIHTYSAYALMLMILLHIGSVVRAEVKEGVPLVSAMITGRKQLSQRPVDE